MTSTGYRWFRYDGTTHDDTNDPLRHPQPEDHPRPPNNVTVPSERLSGAAYTVLHDRSEQRLSGSDLKQVSRWNALGRLLVGRTLLHVAEQTPDGAVQDGLKSAAAALRGSSLAWKKAASAWTGIVDTGDPREHPPLLPPGYAQTRQGTAMKMPSLDPHPAVVISHASTVRVGQLLFGAEWTPDQPPGTARPAAAILADAGGAGALAATAYRLCATGWQMSAAAPYAVLRAEAGLVTSAAEYRPTGLARDRRFYPVHSRQVESLRGAYAAVTGAEQKSASSLLSVAQSTGTPVPRAMLDAAAEPVNVIKAGRSFYRCVGIVWPSGVCWSGLL
ncbi:hypothetical protein ACGFYK_38455, partial [Streptomyces sp. NPDC048340]